jgi:hypothetical protein
VDATLDTRKPIDSLTVDDFTAFPIWEFAEDEEYVAGRDETWVRPVASNTVPLAADAVSVACDFKGPTSLKFDGFVILSTDMAQTNPDGVVLLYRGRYFPLSLGSEAAKRRSADLLGLPIGEVFPLSYEVRVRVDGELEARRGILE